MGTSVKPERMQSEELLHRLWETELDILNAIDSFCRNHHICYALMYGSLLGAVRHGGFIPWDDDVDLIMPRKEYDRFIDLWEKEAPDGYLLVERELYSDYPNNFLKIVKAHTTFLQNESDREKSYPKGIFVDIFPADRFAPTGFRRRIQHCHCLINMLFTRGYSSQKGGAYALAEGTLLRLPLFLREKWRVYTKKQIEKWNDRNDLPYLVPITVKSCQKVYPSDMLDDPVQLDFQGNRYFAPRDPDAVLSIIYKNYKALPPESERVWRHHPVAIDFGHDWEELKESQ